MGMNTESVQRLYVAYFNRPADPVSLATYESLLPSESWRLRPSWRQLPISTSARLLNTLQITRVV